MNCLVSAGHTLNVGNHGLEPFVGKSAVAYVTRDLHRYRDVVLSKEKIWVLEIGCTTHVTHRNVSPCHTNDRILKWNRGHDVEFLGYLFHFNALSREGHGETFWWVKHVIKTISNTQIFSFNDGTSLWRTVGSQPSNTILVLFWILTSPWQNTCNHAFPETEIGTAVSASIELIILQPHGPSP